MAVKAKANSATTQAVDKAQLEALTQTSVTTASLDKLIHEKTRLAIISALAASATLSFNELKQLLDVSDGNLSTHARKLEDVGYIKCSKGFSGRVPRTDYSLTVKGRKALTAYLEHMEALIKVVRQE